MILTWSYTYTQNKLQFNRPSFKDELKDKLGTVCCNCGSNLDVEYHHVVPLALGGTNNIGNIVPLCHVCHHPFFVGIYCLIRLLVSISKREVFTSDNVARLRFFTYSFAALYGLMTLHDC